MDEPSQEMAGMGTRGGAAILCFLVLLVSSRPAGGVPPRCADRTGIGEVGIRDQNGVTLGSRVSPSQQAGERVLVFTHRICNGSSEQVTVTWRSAAFHAPQLGPGKERIEERTYSGGLIPLLKEATVLDIGAMVETRLGTYEITQAPAYQTRWAALLKWTEAQLEKLGRVFVITRSKGSPAEVVFTSTVRRVGKGQFEYTYIISSELGTDLHVQWVAAASKARQYGFITPLAAKDRSLTLRVIAGTPVLVNDLAFYNTSGSDFLPGQDIAALPQTADLRFRFDTIAPSRSKWASGVFVLAPAFVPAGER